MFEVLIPIFLVMLLIVLVLAALFSMWKRVPADKAAVIVGRKKRVISGGGTLVIPVIERMDIITLENVSLSVVSRGAMTSQGVPITADSVAVIKVRNTENDVLTAFEQFYAGKDDVTRRRIEVTAISVLEGKLREIVGKLTVETIYRDREAFSDQVREVADAGLQVMGLELVSFAIKEISDENGYLNALGEPQIAAVKRDAAIAKAEADKEMKIKTAAAEKLGEEARLIAESLIAEAVKNKAVNQAEFDREAQKAQASADAAYSIQQAKVKQEIIVAESDAAVLKQQRDKDIATAEMAVEVEREKKNIELAQTKADAKSRELLETVVNPAEAARRAAEINAEAEKIKQIKQAEADAETKKFAAEALAVATKLEAEADAFRLKEIAAREAEATRLRGQAEADAVYAKLEAEAKGVKEKAAAYREMGEAAQFQIQVEVMPRIMQELVKALPQMAAAIAAPMAEIDKITVWDSGSDEGGGGVMRLPEIVTKTLLASTDSVKELTGFDIQDVLGAFTKSAKVDRNINVSGLENLAASLEGKPKQD
jgi:flotillin